ncbi:hypothetical protein Tco_1418400 [Tanacetum coccineum]
MVLLKVSLWKGAMRFGKRGKLSLRYIGPFKILARVGHVAYTLELPEELKGIHSTFHVSNIKKCLAEGNIVVLMNEIQLDDKLHMIEEPMEIVDREVKRLKQSRIPIVKVWMKRSEERIRCATHRDDAPKGWVEMLTPEFPKSRLRREVFRASCCIDELDLSLKVTKDEGNDGVEVSCV